MRSTVACMKTSLRAALLSLCAVACACAAAAQSRPAITGIAFPRFYSIHPAQANHFYGDQLGYQRIENGGVWEYPVNHAQWIEIIPHDGPKANDKFAAVAFTTRDVTGMEKYLAAKGYPAVKPLHNGEFAVRDPEGNEVIFVQAGSNKLVADAKESPRAASERIIHVGFQVQDSQKEDAFWRQVLGFKPYWHGWAQGDTSDKNDYVSLQVPDGTDWIEYMLNNRPDADLRQHGVMNHFSLGIEKMDTAVAALQRNHCEGPNCSKTQMGRDGKVQLNVFDPDMTRVEFMQFKPSGTVCCSPFAGQHPGQEENQ